MSQLKHLLTLRYELNHYARDCSWLRRAKSSAASPALVQPYALHFPSARMHFREHYVEAEAAWRVVDKHVLLHYIHFQFISFKSDRMFCISLKAVTTCTGNRRSVNNSTSLNCCQNRHPQNVAQRSKSFLILFKQKPLAFELVWRFPSSFQFELNLGWVKFGAT